MRDLLDKLSTLENLEESNTPEIGDEFGISFSPDFEISTHVVEVLEDGIVVELDDTALEMLTNEGVQFLDGELVEGVAGPKSCWKGYRKTGTQPGTGKNAGKRVNDCEKIKEDDKADMSRRGFLGNMGKAAGAGALAAAGLSGAGNAQAFKGTLPSPRISEDEAEAQIKELRGKAYKELASMVWGAWPSILDTTFGGSSSTDKPATPEQIGKMLGYKLAEYADDYRQKVRAIKIAAGVKDPQSLNKTSAAVYINEQEVDEDADVDEAKYQGREVQLGKKMAGDVKKSKVYVKNPQGNIVKVNFGDKKMRIKKSNPARRKSFRARHNCANPGPRHKARYWSCRSW
jgi:hypothetical protein